MEPVIMLVTWDSLFGLLGITSGREEYTPNPKHLSNPTYFLTTTVSILTARFGVHAGIGWQFSGHATLEEARYCELLLQNDLFLKHQ
jgi:hypothetical protein